MISIQHVHCHSYTITEASHFQNCLIARSIKFSLICFQKDTKTSSNVPRPVSSVGKQAVNCKAPQTK